MRFRSFYLLTLFTLLLFVSCKKNDDSTNDDDTDGDVSAETQEISGIINEDMVLTKQTDDPNGIDYLATGDVTLNAEMIIEPGVRIAFEEGVFFDIGADGLLTAEGTEDEMIVFTSANIPAGHLWGGIRVYSSDVRNVLEHVRVEYGNAVNVGLHEGSSISILHCEIANAGDYGLADATTGGGTIIDFESNEFENNGGAAIGVFPDNIAVIDENSTFTGNGFNGVETEGSLTEEATWSKRDYRVVGDLDVLAPLTINPGATFEIDEDVFIQVEEGFISAVGTSEERIVFTTSNPEGEQHWTGIAIFSSDVNNRMDYVTIEYAGNGRMPISYGLETNLYVLNNASLNITNSIIRNSKGYGLVVRESADINTNYATSNTFSDITLDDIKDQD